MNKVLKALMVSECMVVFMSLFFTYLLLDLQETEGEINHHDGQCDYNSGVVLGWIILLIVLGPLFSVSLPIVLIETTSENSQNVGRWARLRTAIMDDRIINGVSAVFTLAVMSAAFEIFSRFIVETYNSDPQRYPSGVVECSGSAGAQYTGQAIISALGPLSFLAARAAGKSVFKCLQQRSYNRTVEQQNLLHSNIESASTPAKGYGAL